MKQQRHRDLWPAAAKRPLIGFAAYSGTGKTTLLQRLIPLLRERGIRLAVIKHAHHDFDIDQPGKDSYQLRKAGAAQVLVSSAQRYALMVDREQPGDPRLDEALTRLDQDSADLILVEGFKHERFPKIELWRAAQGREPLFRGDDSVIAVATDVPDWLEASVPVLDLDNPTEIVRFIEQEVLDRA